MAAKLKVFAWSDGFHSWTVATSSRAKALEAWGAEQDLFKTGLAKELVDGPEREVALASPGTVVRSGLSVEIGEIEPVKPNPARDDAKRARDAARRTALQDRIDELISRRVTELANLQAERAKLDEQITDTEANYDQQVEEAKKALVAFANRK